MTRARTLMIQGTGSDVGKSLLVAGLCRAAKKRGLSVAPFKPQNMSNNAAVAPSGGEIGRAQALQALASGLDPHVDMNPILLKPESETGSQIVVQGKPWGRAKAREYSRIKRTLMAPVLDSFRRLAERHDLVMVEGAGSPAEVNLRADDIANMGFAQAAAVPVILAGDINRGGVIAQLVGTQTVIDPQDEQLIKGFLVNRFRGDVRLFDEGYDLICKHTGWRGFGVVPWFGDAAKLPAEDALGLPVRSNGAGLRIVCLALSRIANFDDLDPLAQEPGVDLSMVRAGEPIPADADLVIVPGSKSTRGDLEFLYAQGWDIDLRAHIRRGGHVLGICGGYQMLGHVVSDPDGNEGTRGDTPGLGLLDVHTDMEPEKQVSVVDAVHVDTGCAISGYEIHIGKTRGGDCVRPFARIGDRVEGAQSPDGRVMGSYLHGMFRSDAFRAAFLERLGGESGAISYDGVVETTLDKLAAHLEATLDVDGLLDVAAAPVFA